MGKHIDELGSFQDFRAPWETETGDEAEIDKTKLKKLLYNARSAKAAALDERDEATEKVAALESDLAEAKKEAATANGEEAAKKIERLEAQLSESKAKVESLEKAQEIAELRAEVLEGVDPKHAKHVKGETREELEASLKEIREDFGIPEPGENDDEDEGEPIVRTTPRVRSVRNPADPDPKAGGRDTFDYDRVADEALGNNVFG